MVMTMMMYQIIVNCIVKFHFPFHRHIGWHCQHDADVFSSPEEKGHFGRFALNVYDYVRFTRNAEDKITRCILGYKACSRGEIKSRVTKIARSSTKPQEHVQVCIVQCALCTEIRIYVSFKFVLLVILVDG